MPNPPRKKTALSRSQYRKQRREQELEEQKKALYENASPKDSRETAELVSRAIRWNTEKQFKVDGKDLTAREIALLATVKGMSNDDQKVVAAHVANLLRMESQNQKDDLEKQDVTGGDNYQQINIYNQDDTLSVLEEMQRSLRHYEFPERRAE